MATRQHGGDDAGAGGEPLWGPAGFLAFLEAHGVDKRDLLRPQGENGGARRFFRLSRLGEEGRVLQEIAAELESEGASAELRRVEWLQRFFSLPEDAPLARTSAYQSGQVFGMDAASGFCVEALGIQPGDHVLDLCCAPGAKLALIAELLSMQGSITGVDCSRPRIGACKQLVHKYQLIQPADRQDLRAEAATGWRCRLFCADGRTFRVGPTDECLDAEDVEVVLDSHEILARGPKGLHRKRKNKSARARDRKRLRDVAGQGVGSKSEPTQLYDKVLVDAECTHDGSTRHLQRLKTLEEWRAYVQSHLNDEQVERILQLQHDLIRNGFRLLRPGGTMIYSTCSLSVRQNEDIVREFLNEETNAEVAPIDRDGIPCQEGRIQGTVRFTPSQNTSGLFVAVIRRKNSA